MGGSNVASNKKELESLDFRCSCSAFLPQMMLVECHGGTVLAPATAIYECKLCGKSMVVVNRSGTLLVIAMEKQDSCLPQEPADHKPVQATQPSLAYAPALGA
jgi:hypothetical protein